MTISRVVFLFALIICLCHEEVLALSSPARVNNGYHFGASSTVAAVPNNKRKLKASDTVVPKRQTSYVPDGLTEEQYNKIKNEELAKTQSMNYGAWGPRFKQVSGDPEFWNWFSSPTLWTGGFNSNSANYNNMTNGGENNSIAQLIRIYMRRYALAYMMILLSTQVLAKSVLNPATKVWSTKYVLARILLPIVTFKPINMLSSLAERRSIPWLKTNGTNKWAAIVALIITAVSFALR